MKWGSTRAIAVFLAWALSTACNAQQPSPDWNGRWNLNPSKSSNQGPVVTISISADGDYRYDDGFSSSTFRCDGRDRPIGTNRTQACVAAPTKWDLTRKENGAKTNTFHWELSADGKVLTATATEFRPTGPVTTSQVVASRLSGSNGFAGQWRNTSYLQQHADLTLRLDSQTLHLSYPNSGRYVDAPFNGADAPVHGPHSSGEITYSVRLSGRREILILTKQNGNALTQGSLELSRDGKVITVSWRNPRHPTDKSLLVYEKK